MCTSKFQNNMGWKCLLKFWEAPLLEHSTRPSTNGMKLLSARCRAWNQPFPPLLLRPCDAALFKLQELLCFLNYFYLPGKTITGNYQSTSWGGPIRKSSENCQYVKSEVVRLSFKRWMKHRHWQIQVNSLKSPQD